MKYKLLKDLPGLKAGTIKYGAGFYWLEPANYPDFFEPIIEKKKFEDLKYWDRVFGIGYNGGVKECMFTWSESKYEIFLTEHDAEMERLRREARANVYLPKNGEKYYKWSFHNGDIYEYGAGDLYQAEYHTWNSHKTKEDAEEYGRKYAKAFEIPNE